MRGIAEGSAVAPGLVSDRRLEASRIDIVGQILRAQVPGARDLSQADRALRAKNLTGADRELCRLGLQQPRADDCRPLGDLAARCRHGATGHDHRARSPGAGRIRGKGGITEHDFDSADVDAEDFMGDLRQRRFEPLAVRVHADAQFQATVRRQPCGCLFVSRYHRDAPAVIDRGAVRGLLAIGRKA